MLEAAAKRQFKLECLRRIEQGTSDAFASTTFHQELAAEQLCELSGGKWVLTLKGQGEIKPSCVVAGMRAGRPPLVYGRGKSLRG
jgi:hypothetical protein